MNGKKSSGAIEPPSSLAELIEFADRENWCTRPVCTTCGAIPFRTALRAIPRDDVITGLRSLSLEFLAKNADMFRLIVSEAAFSPTGGDLLDLLEGTPAANQLQLNIGFENMKYEKRQAYLATQTPEAIARRRAEKKAAKELSTAPHRDRKLASQNAIRAALQELDATPAHGILELVISKDFGIPRKVIGGLVYKRLIKHFKAAPIQPNDLIVLAKLAELHAGHWKKLLGRVA